jgi:hypothetical protein
MSWARDIPLFAMMADLFTLRLRAERLALVRKLHVAESQITAVGGTPDKLREIRHLIQRVPLNPRRDDFVVNLKPKPTASRIEVKTRGNF